MSDEKPSTTGKNVSVTLPPLATLRPGETLEIKNNGDDTIAILANPGDTFMIDEFGKITVTKKGKRDDA